MFTSSIKKIMKIKLTLFLFLFSIINGFAQTNGNINGKVIDKATNSPIPYATIVIKNGTQIITGGITDEKGDFSITKVINGTYDFEVQFIGYKTYNSKISISGKNLNLKSILLEEETTSLNEVELIAERSSIEQRIDRKVINVGKDLISAGATASEIMNNIPSVSVDPQTNQISLRGNSNVRIFIDGKPSTIEPSKLLQQIPSSSIKQIELITNPSAKYNPEGMSGIINIVLHKNSNLGLNGSINGGVTFGDTPKYNSSFDLNYRKGKFNIYGNYGFNTGEYFNNGYINVLEEGEENKQLFNFQNKNTSHLFKVGFDYFINDRNTISFYTNQTFYSGSGYGDTKINFLNPDVDDIFQIYINENKNYNPVFNVDFKHEFAKKGETIELEINLNKNNQEENGLFNYPFTYSQRDNQVNQDIQLILANLDYVNPLSENSSLEVGFESRIDKVSNDFFEFSTYKSDFKYKRNIHSAYATYGKQWEKWSTKLGARLENYKVDATFNNLGNPEEKYSDEIFSIYPSAYLTYNPSEKNSFNLSYSRRVDRPSIQQVNPIREWSTPQIDSKGNPELKPQFTNSIELNYTRKTKLGSISSSVFYRRIHDEISRAVYENPEDPAKILLTYDNFDSNDAFGFEISGYLEFTKWFNSNISFDLYSKTTRGVVVDELVEVNPIIFNARMNNTFKLTKNLKLQQFIMYRGEDEGLQFVREPMWRSDLGASLTILKGAGTLTARMSDIFNSMNFSYYGSRPQEQEGAFYWESQTFYIGFNYRFGSGKEKALQRKQRDKNEKQGSGGII